MRKTKALRRLLLLAIAGAALGGVLAVQLSDLRAPPPVNPSAASASESVSEPPARGLFELRMPEAYDIVSEAPIFRETRAPYEPPQQPAAPEKPAPPPVEEPPPEVKLSGVMITPGATSAMIRDIKTGKSRRIVVGAEVNGWTVAEIDEDAIVFRRGSDQATVLLRPPEEKAEPPSRSAQPPPVPRPRPPQRR